MKSTKCRLCGKIEQGVEIGSVEGVVACSSCWAEHKNDIEILRSAILNKTRSRTRSRKKKEVKFPICQWCGYSIKDEDPVTNADNKTYHIDCFDANKDVIAKEKARADLESMNRVQPAPTEGTGPAIWDLVMADMAERKKMGEKKYNRVLRANNGHDNLLDAYQEALDLAVYLRTEIEERRVNSERSATSG